VISERKEIELNNRMKCSVLLNNNEIFEIGSK